MSEHDDDDIRVGAGMVVEFDQREIAILIAEGVLSITRPEGFDTDQAFDHIGELNPVAQADFLRAARKVLTYIEEQLSAAGTVRT